MSLINDERKFGKWTITNSQLAYPTVIDKTLWGFVDLDVTDTARKGQSIVFWGKPGKKLRFHVTRYSYRHYRKLQKYRYNHQFQIWSNFCTWKSSLLHFRPGAVPAAWLSGMSTALFDNLIEQIDKKIIWETLKD